MIRLSACPVCDCPAEGSKVIHRREADSLRGCRGCGSLFADPQREPEELARIYEEDFYNEEQTTRRGRTAWGEEPRPLTYEVYARVLLSRYPSLRRSGVRVLDYGCGMGQFLAVMRDRGAEVRGIELSEIAARHCRERLGLEVLAGTEDALEALPDRSFDLVSLFSVLEHVCAPTRLAELVRRKLAPGGVVCAVVPNVASLRHLFQGAGCREFRMRTHLTIWSMRGVRTLFAHAGLVDVRRLVFWGGRAGFGPLRSLAQYVVRLAGRGSALSVAAERPASG